MRIYENRVKICKFISKENDDLPMHMMHIMSGKPQFVSKFCFIEHF